MEYFRENRKLMGNEESDKMGWNIPIISNALSQELT